MKKRILICVSVLTALALTLSGCGVFGILKNAKNNQPDAEKEQTETTVAPEPAPTPEIELTDQDPIDEGPADTGSKDAVKTLLEKNQTALVSKGELEYDIFTMTIPDCWDQRVYAKTADQSIIFYEAMSYDIEEDMGYLFAVVKTDNQVGQYAGERYYAYSDDYFYYISYPTDVPYLYEEEGVMEDYSELSYAAQRLVDTIVIDDPTVKYDANDFVCPMSSTKPIPEEVFYDISGDDIIRARDEIYARNGQVFNDYYTQNYFDSCAWYERSRNDELTEKDFSKTEWDNIKLLSEQLYAWQQEHPYPKYVWSGEETKDMLNEKQGEVTIKFSVDTVGEHEYNAVFTVDGKKYTTEDFGIELENPDDSFFCVTSINPYYGGKEVAFLDFGNDDNNVTYFFSVNDDCEFVYIGSISGCPFKGTATASCDGFSEAGTVMATERTYILGSESYYVSTWFDPTELSFREGGWEGQEFRMVPSGKKTTKESLTIYKEYEDGTSVPMDIEKGTDVFFVSTDNIDKVTIRTKDGRQGVLHVTDDMSSNPDKYFEFHY